jgi:signal transduction protein with GAF and PtsI domain
MTDHDITALLAHLETLRVLGRGASQAAFEAIPAIAAALAAERERAEKWERITLVAEERANVQVADMLAADGKAIGHQWTDAAAVFMRKAKWMERERDAAENERDNQAGLVMKALADRDDLARKLAEAERGTEQAVHELHAACARHAALARKVAALDRVAKAADAYINAETSGGGAVRKYTALCRTLAALADAKETTDA